MTLQAVEERREKREGRGETGSQETGRREGRKGAKGGKGGREAEISFLSQELLGPSRASSVEWGDECYGLCRRRYILLPTHHQAPLCSQDPLLRQMLWI